MSDTADAPRGGELTLWERLRRWSGLAPDEQSPSGDSAEWSDAETLDEHERLLIRNVLRLRTLTALDVMVPRIDIIALPVETPFREAVARLVEEGHSRVPVYRDNLDQIVGMVHVKDVLGFVAAGRETTLQKLLRNVLFVAPSTHVLDVLTQMRLQRVHMAFVVDEFGGIDGLVTIEDLVEEIVGEIEDEHDEAEPSHIMERPDGSLIVDARTPIDELERVLDLKLHSADSEEEVDTVGGLVFVLFDRVPKRGEHIRHPAGVALEVLDADDRRVRNVRIRRLSDEDEAEPESSAHG